jgi:hypothetical protein
MRVPGDEPFELLRMDARIARRRPDVACRPVCRTPNLAPPVAGMHPDDDEANFLGVVKDIRNFLLLMPASADH